MNPTVPETMAAVLLTGHGGMEKLEYREDFPVPGPGAGEVLIKVVAAGVNNTDINTRIDPGAPEPTSSRSNRSITVGAISGQVAIRIPRTVAGWACPIDM